MQEDTAPSNISTTLPPPVEVDDAAVAPTPPAVLPPEAGKISRTTRVWGGMLGCLGSFTLGIVVLGGIAGAVAFIVYRQPAVTSDTTQTLTVSGPQHLVVRGDASDVQVNAGPDNTMTIEVKKSARAISQKAAQQILNDFRFSVTQSGNVVTVKQQNASFLDFFSERQMTIIITVPAQTSLSNNLSAGDLTVNGIIGQMNLDDSAGNIRLNDVTISGASRIQESAGDVSLSGQMTPGASLNVKESAGNISFSAALATNNHLTFDDSAGDINLHLPASTDAHISAHSSAGDISIHGWPIEVSRDVASASASGNTSADANPTNTITITESAGNISINSH